MHRADGLLVLEFEPAEGGGDFLRLYAPVRRALERLQQARTVADACAAAAQEVRALTGYDRVVAYRFASVDGPGEVIAEDVTQAWEPWLGLWFPATDIPPQARRLYETNWIRVITDVDDPTAPADAHDPARDRQPLDLSRSVLRTVSGFHIEYLRNIGVTSSMSVSLLFEGRLWGLIACHGREPVVLGPELRAACEFFGVALSLHLAALRERDESAQREAARRRSDVTQDLLVETPGPLGPAPGCSRSSAPTRLPCRVGGETTVHGAPVEQELIVDILSAAPPDEGLWHSDHLGLERYRGRPAARWCSRSAPPATAWPGSGGSGPSTGDGQPTPIDRSPSVRTVSG